MYSFGASLSTAIKQVTVGQSDYLNAAPFVSSGQSHAALGLLQTLDKRYGSASVAARPGRQRYFVDPWQDVEYFVFNTRRPLFASARLRQAVNYAIDRPALVQHHFLFNGGLATDHHLPPGVPGSRSVDVYPLGAPKLGKAKSLAAGIHAHATMYTCTFQPQCQEDAQIIKTDLAKIDIKLTIIKLPAAEFYSALGPSRRALGYCLQQLGRGLSRPR